MSELSIAQAWNHWFKLVVAAGVVLGAAAVAVNHTPLLLISIGLVFWGVGEFISHPYLEIVYPGQGKKSGRPHDPSLLGWSLDILGWALILYGIYRVIVLD